MKETVTTSKKYTINWRDAGKGLLVAIGTAVGTTLQSAFNPETLHFNWKMVVGASIAAMFAYLVKNFLSPATVKTPIE